MIRTLNFLLAIIAALALVGVYALKYGVEGTAARKSELVGMIAHHKSDLSVLAADWAYLNQPNHIEPVVRRHAEALGLDVAVTSQFISFDDLPMRPETTDQAGLDALFQAIDAGIDPIAALIEEDRNGTR